AMLVTLRYDAYQLDLKIWVAVLLVQSIPYFASVLVSLISAMQWLPASLVGVMPAMSGLEEEGARVEAIKQVGLPRSPGKAPT
ncbi:MAG: hypothetical protein IT487_19630, partial [Chromatiaceae bacterium]|nr:hypothetical protein [Chromatiaceae bacterium]